MEFYLCEDFDVALVSAPRLTTAANLNPFLTSTLKTRLGPSNAPWTL